MYPGKCFSSNVAIASLVAAVGNSVGLFVVGGGVGGRVRVRVRVRLRLRVRVDVGHRDGQRQWRFGAAVAAGATRRGEVLLVRVSE